MSDSAGSIDPRMNTRNRLLNRNTGTRICKGLFDLGFDQCVKPRTFRGERWEQVEIAGGGFFCAGCHAGSISDTGYDANCQIQPSIGVDSDIACLEERN